MRGHQPAHGASAPFRNNEREPHGEQRSNGDSGDINITRTKRAEHGQHE